MLYAAYSTTLLLLEATRPFLSLTGVWALAKLLGASNTVNTLAASYFTLPLLSQGAGERGSRVPPLLPPLSLSPDSTRSTRHQSTSNMHRTNIFNKVCSSRLHAPTMHPPCLPTAGSAAWQASPPAPCSLRPAPCALRSALCALRSALCALRSAPCACALRPAPCALLPAPCSLRRAASLQHRHPPALRTACFSRPHNAARSAARTSGEGAAHAHVHAHVHVQLHVQVDMYMYVCMHHRRGRHHLVSWHQGAHRPGASNES